jgi:hypothetical protein
MKPERASCIYSEAATARPVQKRKRVDSAITPMSTRFVVLAAGRRTRRLILSAPPSDGVRLCAYCTRQAFSDMLTR